MKREIVKRFFSERKIKPQKRLGQNFLIDERVIKKIIATAELSKNDIVLEVGAGIGNLTEELAKRAKKVLAVEKDEKMVEILNERLKGFENVKVIKEDILKLKATEFNLKDYKLIGNLPFYIGSAVIRKFLEKEKRKPYQMVLILQKEVAQRICAKPPRMNLLAVSVQFYAEPKIIAYISKRSFWPQPEVDSAIVRIILQKIYYQKLQHFEVSRFFQIVRAGFSHPRKQLINNFSTGLKIEKEKIKKWLLENNIQPWQRGETLSIDDWLRLTKNSIINKVK